MRKIFLALAAVLMVPALAWAAPMNASDWYKEGSNQYTLGNYEKAAEAFKKGFELENDESKQPAYLYNIAQSYRLANDCVRAQFFYKRFLLAAGNNTAKPLTPAQRKSVEDFIKDLDPCAQQAAQMGKRPPENLQASEPGDKTQPDISKPRKEVATTTPDSDGEQDKGGEGPIARSAAPSLISARFTGGGSKIYAGNIAVPVQATFAAMVGYPVAINDKLTIDVGAAGTLTAIPYTRKMSESETAYLISAVADAGVTYEVMPKLGARADIGLGALFFSNVSGSAFIGERDADGALTMFHLRFAVSADYAVTPNIVVTATPFAFSYSPPKAGLDDSIKSLMSIDFMIGLGYRM